MPRHIIHKQQVHLKTCMTAGAFNLQTRVCNLLRDELSNKLEELFNEASPGGKILRIDKLELNVGTIHEQNLEAEFSERLLEQLSQKLSELDAQVGSTETGLGELSEQQSVAESLIFFLDHGVMPWHEVIKSIFEFESKVLDLFSESEWRILINALRERISSHNTAIRRLVIQFSDSLLEKILFRLQRQLDKGWSSHFQKMQEYLIRVLAGTNYSKADVRSFTWEIAITTALNSKTEDEFEREFTESITHNAQARGSTKKSLFNDGESGPAGLQEKKEDQKRQLDKKIKKTENGEEEFFTNNCGIIIVHSFLKEYFNELGLLEGKFFKDSDLQQRAVLLLHYLATGETHVAEFNLLVPKLLCNLDFNEPVPNEIELTKEEKQESDNLLKAVTEHWQPLKRTSVEGLRSSFFQREGKLTRSDTGWTLHVEQKTIDILLDKLPWGIGTIKLPWMDQLLNVEWA